MIYEPINPVPYAKVPSSLKSLMRRLKFTKKPELVDKIGNRYLVFLNRRENLVINKRDLQILYKSQYVVELEPVKLISSIITLKITFTVES